MTVPPAPEPIPVRALNQVTYCPRLYFLEYVEGLMTNNEHVEGGLFEHRRVTDPELAGRTRKDGEALHTRSVAISSEKLGITATLDVIEEKGGAVYPVEYKRGSGTRDETALPRAHFARAASAVIASSILDRQIPGNHEVRPPLCSLCRGAPARRVTSLSGIAHAVCTESRR
jgi:hypothetical protein